MFQRLFLIIAVAYAFPEKYFDLPYAPFDNDGLEKAISPEDCK